MKKKEYAKHGTRRLLAALLCAVVTLTAIPIPAMAAATQNIAEEKSREDSLEFIIEDGVLKKYKGEGGDVVVPEGVTRIGSQAFLGCSSLTSVELPESVIEISDGAFMNCSNLITIKLPESITNIKSSVFKGTKWLTKKREENPLVIVNHILVDGQTAQGDVVIPEGVTSIAEVAFVGSKVTTVTIPESVTSIGSRAFDGTAWLRKKQEENPLVIVNHILIDGTKAKGKVTIPETVTSIAGAAFEWNENLTSVTIPDNVRSIGPGAFSSCKKMSSVRLSKSITSIAERTFSSCLELDSVTILEGITNIGDSAFNGCVNLRSVSFPKSVKHIGHGAFSGCKNLGIISGLGDGTSIGGRAFAGTLLLTRAQNRDPLVTINHILVDGTTAQGDVVIPEGVTSIADEAFTGCVNLTSVTLSKDITRIGNCAFKDCSSLTSVTIPEGVKSIGNRAFENCNGLTSVTIPKSVTSISNTAFFSCTELATIYGATNSEAQTYAKKYGFSFISTDPPVEKPSISNAIVTIKPYTATGKAIKPTKGIIVKLNGKTLVYGRDYKVTKYANNTNPGTASVTIAGIGDYSGTRIKTFKINLATPGSAKQSARTTTSIKLSWKKVPGATSYVVERAPYGSKKFKKTATVKTTSYTNKKLATGQFYQYRVRAYCGKLASACSKTVTANTSISTPSISKVTSPRKKQAVVTWKKTKGVTGYQVYRATSKNGKYKKVATVKSTKYTDKKVSRKKTYYYKVRAYKKVKSKTIYSGYSKAKGKKVK